MNKTDSAAAFMLILVIIAASVIPFAAQTRTGDLRFHAVESKVFGNTRIIRVLVPPGYDEAENRERTYPVLYLNDGQNLFDSATAVFNPKEWSVDETVGELIAAGKIEPLIVVGIDNAGKKDRPNEYLPWEDEFLSPPSPDPKGAKYPKFLIDEVIPFVEKMYRVDGRRNRRALGGSSYGALITLYTLTQRPDVFGLALLESPSLYVSGAKVLSLAENLEQTPYRIYVGVGTNEEGKKNCEPGEISSEAVTDVKRLALILGKKGLGPERLNVVIEECAVHDEDAWAGRLSVALQFLFPAVTR